MSSSPDSTPASLAGQPRRQIPLTEAFTLLHSAAYAELEGRPVQYHVMEADEDDGPDCLKIEVAGGEWHTFVPQQVTVDGHALILTEVGDTDSKTVKVCLYAPANLTGSTGAAAGTGDTPTPPTPSPGAMRTACALLNEDETVRTHRCINGQYQWTHYDRDDVAAIIDRETGLAAALTALRPFADLIENAAIADSDADGESFMTATDPLGIRTRTILTVGDLRRARAVIAEHGQPVAVPVLFPA